MNEEPLTATISSRSYLASSLKVPRTRKLLPVRSTLTAADALGDLEFKLADLAVTFRFQFANRLDNGLEDGFPLDVEMPAHPPFPTAPIRLLVVGADRGVCALGVHRLGIDHVIRHCGSPSRSARAQGATTALFDFWIACRDSLKFLVLVPSITRDGDRCPNAHYRA
jgi:hypothetical protein